LDCIFLKVDILNGLQEENVDVLRYLLLFQIWRRRWHLQLGFFIQLELRCSSAQELVKTWCFFVNSRWMCGADW